MFSSTNLYELHKNIHSLSLLKGHAYELILRSGISFLKLKRERTYMSKIREMDFQQQTTTSRSF